MKIDVSTLRRPQTKSTTYTFKDPLQEVPVVMTLRAIDPLEEDRALEHASQLVRTYITGGWLDLRTNDVVKDPLPFHAVDGVPVELSERAIRFVCMLAAMQTGPEDTKYTAEELLSIAVCYPTAWLEIQKTFYQIQNSGWSGEELTATGNMP